MGGREFDQVARALARGGSRRSLLRRAALTVGVVGLTTGAPRSVAAHHCDFSGCGCYVGGPHGCGEGLICCAFPSIAGQAGICLPPDACGPQCRETGASCTDVCVAGEHCLYCCSDVCDYDGTCR